MKKDRDELNRRNFIKTIGAAGLSSVFASKALADANEPNLAEPNAIPKEKLKFPKLPKRILGKTKFKVPVLSSGVAFNAVDNQIILKANLKYNVTYWDTAYGYAGGNAELGIGKFLKKHPKVRKNLFIVSKASWARTIEDVENRLQESLKRMNTDYIDLYHGVHRCNDPENLTDELRKWSESAKKRKLIRYFGFSTHENMEKCLMAASKLEWIDAIMSTYNINKMQSPEMQEAVQACFESSVGLIAMKVINKVQKKDNDAENEIIGHFLEKGYTREQALIKAVLADKRIAVACITMPNLNLLKTNVAAVLDKAELAPEDIAALQRYSEKICSGYCAGCSDICGFAVKDMPYVSEVMRYLMYYNSYGDRQRARDLFAKLPSKARNRVLRADYSLAEKRCPQHMPIANLMAEAASKLA